MIRSALVLRIAEQNPHLHPKDAEAAVDAMLDRIARALADGDRIELRDFGAFSMRGSLARTGRNPRTGGEVTVKAKRQVHFKMGKGMRSRLNLEKADPKQEAERILRAS